MEEPLSPEERKRALLRLRRFVHLIRAISGKTHLEILNEMKESAELKKKMEVEEKKNTERSRFQKKKTIILIYYLWLCLNLILLSASLISSTNRFFEDSFEGFWPFEIVEERYGRGYSGHGPPPIGFVGRSAFNRSGIEQYTIDEFLVYTMLPLLIFVIWRRIEKKHFFDDDNPKTGVHQSKTNSI